MSYGMDSDGVVRGGADQVLTCRAELDLGDLLGVDVQCLKVGAVPSPNPHAAGPQTCRDDVTIG
eukprot:scaffold647865_cov40-Prasinocladus_malaysianus.AAC.2